MPSSITIPTLPPSEILRQTKVASLTKYLSHTLRIDRSALLDSFGAYSIVDISFRFLFSGTPIHDNLLARLKISDAIGHAFFEDNEPWVRCNFTSFLVLKEYKEGETRAHLNHESYATMLVREWPKPDLTIHIMYLIADVDSEVQGDYLMRAFTVQLGAAVLEKFYDEELQEELLALDSAGMGWLDFLKLLIAKLENGGSDKRRIFVALHGARAEQVIQLVKLIAKIACDWLSPIFQFLISGQGADRVAESIGCATYQMPFVEEFYVRLTPIEEDEVNEEDMVGSAAARQQWKMMGGWKCKVIRMV